MSYKTVASHVFPPIMQNFRGNQEFNALQVGDPKRKSIQRSPPDTGRRGSPERSRDRDRPNSGLNILASQQDMLLKNQMQVAQNQDELARRLNDQNTQLTQALIQRAISNKDSMIANLQQQQGLDWEQHTRELLEQHIRAIVAVVQRLGLDIEALEAELQGRDLAVVGTNKAVNKLEVHHVTMLQDLRGRIVRCDAAIGKHTKDLMYVLDELKRLEGQQYGSREKILNDIHRLEAEVMSMTGELERQTGEQRSELNHFRTDALHRLNTIEDKNQANMLQVRDMIEGNRSALNGYIDRLDSKFTGMINKATEGWSNMMSQIDQRIADGIYAIDARVVKVENAMAQDRARLKDLEKNITYNVMAALKENLAFQDEQLHKAKDEFREGFTEIQDSLHNMKRVVEGRRQLLGNHLRREIGKVKQTMFMEMPPAEAGTTIVYNPKVNAD